MAAQQEKELQSLFDENDILRAQGQGSVVDHTEDIAERLQEKLDERDHVDEKEPIEEETTEEIIENVEDAAETVENAEEAIEEIEATETEE